MTATATATVQAPVIDQARAEAFGGRMVGVLNDACLALMTSIGHRVGLFDTLAGLSPATSEQIADAAGLRERYVREWLGAMTTSAVVEYEPETRTYRLPPEHAACLTGRPDRTTWPASPSSSPCWPSLSRR